jgi:hypothetical protein
MYRPPRRSHYWERQDRQWEFSTCYPLLGRRESPHDLDSA